MQRAPRTGRKAVCIFHAGAAPAVIENIYMLFMGHTCFKNQTRHRASPVSRTPRTPLTLSLFLLSRASLASLLLTSLYARKPLFRLFSSADCLPFSVSPFPAGRRILPPPPHLLWSTRSRLLHSLPKQPPEPAGNVSRILQNVSRLSCCFRFLPTDETTNTRMD